MTNRGDFVGLIGLCRLSAAILLALLFASASFAQQQGIITTVAGGGPNNLPATDANLARPHGVVVDNAGNFFIAATSYPFQ